MQVYLLTDRQQCQSDNWYGINPKAARMGTKLGISYRITTWHFEFECHTISYFHPKFLFGRMHLQNCLDEWCLKFSTIWKGTCKYLIVKNVDLWPYSWNYFVQLKPYKTRDHPIWKEFIITLAVQLEVLIFQPMFSLQVFQHTKRFSKVSIGRLFSPAGSKKAFTVGIHKK